MGGRWRDEWEGVMGEKGCDECEGVMSEGCDEWEEV